MLDSRILFVWFLFLDSFATDFEQDPLITDLPVIHSSTLRVNVELRLHAQQCEGSIDRHCQQSPTHNLKRKPAQ